MIFMILICYFKLKEKKCHRLFFIIIIIKTNTYNFLFPLNTYLLDFLLPDEERLGRRLFSRFVCSQGNENSLEIKIIISTSICNKII